MHCRNKQHRSNFQASSLLALVLLFSGAPTLLAQGLFALRLNCGATSTVTDAQGQSWLPDAPYILSTSMSAANTHTANIPINGTSFATLYQTERYFNIYVPVPQYYGYEITVPKAAKYQIRCHFAEIHFTTAGSRVFGLSINGSIQIGRLDLIAQVGYATAYVYDTTLQVNSGTVQIALMRDTEYPKISAIEVLESVSAPVPAPRPAPVAVPTVGQSQTIRINAGGASITTPDGKAWVTDSPYLFSAKGGTTVNTLLEIANTTNDVLYQSERYFNRIKDPLPSVFGYQIPVTKSGTYRVRLHFAEIFFQAVDKRSFDVKIEGTPAISALDLVAVVGYSHAYVYEKEVAVTDGKVDIEFAVVKNNPKISAVEIIALDSGGPETIRINVGGAPNTYTDSAGNIWIPDTLSIGKVQKIDCSTADPIIGTTNDGIYCSSKWFSLANTNNAPFRFDIPVTVQGTYTVRLHFAELVSETCSKWLQRNG